MYVKDTDVVLDCGSVCEIDGKKSLIIENGNLFIKSDMKYANANSVLGLILIGNKDGTKNIVRISENITNGVGVLYSEGPIISAKSNGTLYSGSNIGELDLLNQLYWKGSFATRNTVGGSIKNTPDCPFGTSEYLAGNCNADNSKTYDLIYLRRYGRIAESGIGVTNNSMGDTRVPFGLKEGATVKTAGGRVMTYEAPATVNFGSATLPVPQARSGNVNTYNSPLILEYDAKLQTNPPPGFVKN